MVEHIRISSPANYESKPARLENNQARGTWRGIPVSVSTARDVDDEIRKQEYRQENGIDARSEHRPIRERSIDVDAHLLPPMSRESLARLAKTFGGQKDTTRLAREYLDYLNGNRTKPKAGKSLQNLVAHYVAMHKLAAALNASDEDFVAKLTPGRGEASTLAELAQELIDAGDDPEKLRSTLQDVEGLPQESDELHALMNTLRFNPQQLKRKLRDAQKLPTISEENKRQMQEQLDDLIQQFEIDEGSRIRAARNGIDNGFQSSDPEGFISSYSEVLEAGGSFLQTLRLLSKRHPPTELHHVIPLMKQSLADELQLGQDERSTDKAKLECLLSELSHMHISTTLLEKLSRLVAGVRRIYGNAAAA